MARLCMTEVKNLPISEKLNAPNLPHPRAGATKYVSGVDVKTVNNDPRVESGKVVEICQYLVLNDENRVECKVPLSRDNFVEIRIGKAIEWALVNTGEQVSCIPHANSWSRLCGN